MSNAFFKKKSLWVSVCVSVFGRYISLLLTVGGWVGFGWDKLTPE
jgi:hypothetical protein